jgi:hypothetical protein
VTRPRSGRAHGAAHRAPDRAPDRAGHAPGAAVGPIGPPSGGLPRTLVAEPAADLPEVPAQRGVPVRRGAPVAPGGPVLPDEPEPPAPRFVPALPDGPEPRSRSGLGVLAAAAAGSLVAVGLGVYGRLHEPADAAFDLAGFSGGLAAKSWLATLAFALALVQLWSARAMYGRTRRPAPHRAGALHRWSGRVAVLLTVPVAVHCLYALGYQDTTARVLLHSLAGCFLYGAFVTKMLVLQQARSPRWSLPLLGGALFTALTAVWSSSAAWFFSTSGLTF